jgi:GH35 family endo-1,4-beta-xylanase
MLNRCKTPANNAAYEKEFTGLLNYATLPFYWWVYEPQSGRPNYADTEHLVAWCAAHHIAMKGHPLAWNEGQPSWLPADLTEVTRLQMQRIADIVGRFKGEIGIWDVVNEATDFDRNSTREGGPTLTAAIRQMGVQDYLRTAFARAREANPQATLVINDYVTSELPNSWTVPAGRYSMSSASSATSIDRLGLWRKLGRFASASPRPGSRCTSPRPPFSPASRAGN